MKLSTQIFCRSKKLIQEYLRHSQYVVIPTRRSLAESVQILISHAFGDAISPYIIGQVRLYLK